MRSGQHEIANRFFFTGPALRGQSLQVQIERSWKRALGQGTTSSTWSIEFSECGPPYKRDYLDSLLRLPVPLKLCIPRAVASKRQDFQEDSRPRIFIRVPPRLCWDRRFFRTFRVALWVGIKGSRGCKLVFRMSGLTFLVKIRCISCSHFDIIHPRWINHGIYWNTLMNGMQGRSRKYF